MKFAKFTTALTVLLLSSPALAQGLPNIYGTAKIELKPVQSLAEFPRFTFIENMLELNDGRIAATSTMEGKIYLINGDEISVLARLEEGEVLCLEHFGDDIIVTANVAAPEGSANPPSIMGEIREGALFRVTLDGKVEELARMPEVFFANGIAKAADGRYLIAASGRGRIYSFDPQSGKSEIWLDHAALAPGKVFPIGVNGLRVRDGNVYFANTGQMTLGKINYNTQEVTTLHQGALVDDFAVGRDGTIYGATHAFDSVVRFSPDGSRTIVSDATQGATGSTSVRFDANGDLLVSTGGKANYKVLGLDENAAVPSHVLRISLH